MNITRRDVLKLTGGSIAGMFFTPLPWKLLDDSAIWTQNWSLTPPLPRGNINYKFSHCSLCVAGCSVQAKCVNDIPFGLVGTAKHPIHHGYLCAQGLAGHHLAHHPFRIKGAKKFLRKHDNAMMLHSSYEEIINAVAERIKHSKGITAILDQNPNRTYTKIYNEFAGALANGMYVSSPSQENELLQIIAEMSGSNNSEFGFDFERTNLIVNFGTNLIDGFGTPGRIQNILSQQKKINLKLVHIEPTKSRTAQIANEWLPLNAGMEYTLAVTILNIMLFEHHLTSSILARVSGLESIKESLQQFLPSKTAKLIGLSESEIRGLAKEILAAQAAITLASPEPGSGPFEQETMNAIALINVLSGNIGRQGGIVQRKSLEQRKSVKRWNAIPNNSISVLIIDPSESGYAIPWNVIERKLQTDALILSLSPYLNSFAGHADFILPSPVPYEAMNEISSAADMPFNLFSVAQPIETKKDFSSEPEEVISAIATKLGISLSSSSREEMLKAKAKTIFALKRGKLFDLSENVEKSISELADSDEFWTKLKSGAVWIDEDSSKQPKMRFDVLKAKIFLPPQIESRNNISDLKLIPVGVRGSFSNATVSPILSKVYQESELRPLSNTVMMNPRTAHELQIHSNDFAILETKNGTMNVRIKTDESVQPNCILAAIGPSANGATSNENAIFELCDIQNDTIWRITNATVRKV